MDFMVIVGNYRVFNLFLNEELLLGNFFSFLFLVFVGVI